jgi:hypothetical protein
MDCILNVMRKHQAGMRLIAQSGRPLALDAQACSQMAEELDRTVNAAERLLSAAKQVRDLARNPWPGSAVVIEATERARAGLDEAIRDFESSC